MLQLLATEEDLGLIEISSALHLPKTTAHGLLRTLVDVGFVEQTPDTGRYRVSADLFRLGSTRFDVNELRARAINWADALAARTGESARVAAFRAGEPVLAHLVRRGDVDRDHAVGRPGARPPGADDPDAAASGPDHPAYPAVGSQISTHANALGKILLAFDPGAARSLRDAHLPSLTHRTIVERGAMQRELAGIRDRGYAAAVEEEEKGLAGVAAPIRDRGGYVVGAIGVEGPSSRLCDSRLRPREDVVVEVQRAASAVSRELGHGRLA